MTSTRTLPAESPYDHQNRPKNPACLGMYQSILKFLNPGPPLAQKELLTPVPLCPSVAPVPCQETPSVRIGLTWKWQHRALSPKLQVLLSQILNRGVPDNPKP